MGLFDQTFRCPHCGHPCLSPKEAAKHCDQFTHADRGLGGLFGKGRECPDCKGSGVSYGLLGGKRPCPRCDGRGKI